jgi:hypothetical protein
MTYRLQPRKSRSTASRVRLLKFPAIVIYALVASLRAQGVPSQIERGGLPKSIESARVDETALGTTILFSFDIRKLQTDHQFKGQRNTFRFTYEYSGILKSPGTDAKGYNVPANTYPFFQEVRSNAIEYIRTYPTKGDFYEVFGLNICRYILERYSQIRRIELEIEIPGHGGVKLDRREKIVLVRKEPGVVPQ